MRSRVAATFLASTTRTARASRGTTCSDRRFRAEGTGHLHLRSSVGMSNPKRRKRRVVRALALLGVGLVAALVPASPAPPPGRHPAAQGLARPCAFVVSDWTFQHLIVGGGDRCPRLGTVGRNRWCPSTPARCGWSTPRRSRRPASASSTLGVTFASIGGAAADVYPWSGTNGSGEETAREHAVCEDGGIIAGSGATRGRVRLG